MKIDFEHYLGFQIAQMEVDNLELDRQLMVIDHLKPKFGKDGSQFCYLLGEMPEHYIAGWGDTPHYAMRDFVNNFYNEKAK